MFISSSVVKVFRSISFVLLIAGVVMLILSIMALQIKGSVETWLYEMFTIRAGEAVARCGLFPPGTILDISVKVISGDDVNFLVAPRSEWEKVKDEIFAMIIAYDEPSRDNIRDFNVTWHPPGDVEICFILNNPRNPLPAVFYMPISVSNVVVTIIAVSDS